MDVSLDAAAAGAPDAAALAVEAMRRCHEAMTVVMDFWQNWIFASGVVRDHGNRDELIEMIGLVDLQTAPSPVGITAQRTRLEARLAEIESAPAVEIEQKYVDALGLMQSWGATVFEALTCARA